MHPAEIVERKEQRHGRFVVFPFLAMGIGQASQAANLHPKRFIAALNVARANLVFIRIAEPGSSDNVNYRSRRVTSIILRFSVDLHQGCEIDAPTKDRRNRRPVWREAVRGQLEASLGRVIEVVGEDRRIIRRSLPDVVSQDQFRVPFNRREAPHVAECFRRIETLASLFLHADESPYFVSLDVVYLDVMHGLLHERLALLASFDHRANDRIAANMKHALQGADAATFQEHVENRQHLFRLDASLILGTGRFVREGLFADIATMTLRAIPIPTETTGAALTDGTKHNRPLFLCCGGSARMRLTKVAFWPNRLIVIAPDSVESSVRGFLLHHYCTHINRNRQLFFLAFLLATL